MSDKPRMGKTLPEGAQGTHREQGSPEVPQLALAFDAAVQINADRSALRELARRAREVAGRDIYWLAVALGKPLTYASKISEGEAGLRPYQIEWLAPLLQEPAARAVIAEWFCRRDGRDVPGARKKVDAATAQEKALQVIRRRFGDLLLLVRAAVAEECDVAPEDVPL